MYLYFIYIYLDVLGSAKGWAASLAFHPNVKKSLESFMSKKNTFSLGVCNGCQLMCNLGLVGKLLFLFLFFFFCMKCIDMYFRKLNTLF